MTPPRPLPAAEKQRRYRERKRAGSRIASTEISSDVIEGLIRHGWISAEEAKDPSALGAALADLADCYCDGRLARPEVESVTG